MFREAVSAPGVLNMPSTYSVILLARLLPLRGLQRCQLHAGDTADSSSLAMVTHVGLSFLDSAQSLDVYNTTFLVDLHICGQRDNSVFPKRPIEHIASVSPFTLCVGHFGELLKDSGPGQKEGKF